MKVVSTKLANPEWELLQNKCNDRGVTIAEHLRGLVRSDSNKTTLREEVQAASEKEGVIESGKHAEPHRTSGLAWLSEKKPSATSRELSESPTAVEDMREEIRKQGVTIQSMASQLREMNKKVDEQRKRQTVEPRPEVRKIRCEDFNNSECASVIRRYCS